MLTGDNGPFGGNHIGGTNVLLVDGSVHFLKTPFDPVNFEFGRVAENPGAALTDPDS